MNNVRRRKIFEIFRQQNPHPVTELNYSSPFELLVAVILSAQATDVSVNKATSALFKAANSPRDMLNLGLDKLKQFIKSIGLYNTKAMNILKTCEILVREHGGEVPDNREALERLPGVGRKTANVILNTAFGRPVIAVDTHIFRVANRTGIAAGKNVQEVEKKLLQAVPDEFRQDAHHWLILHGRYVCTARNPHCARCVIHNYCDWEGKNREC